MSYNIWKSIRNGSRMLKSIKKEEYNEIEWIKISSTNRVMHLWYMKKKPQWKSKSTLILFDFIIMFCKEKVDQEKRFNFAERWIARSVSFKYQKWFILISLPSNVCSIKRTHNPFFQLSKNSFFDSIQRLQIIGKKRKKRRIGLLCYRYTTFGIWFL